MSTEKEFLDWLITSQLLSSSTVDTYSQSLTKISDYLKNSEIIESNIFEVDDINLLKKVLDEYFENKENQEENLRGHRKISAAANNLIRFYEEGSYYSPVYDKEDLHNKASQIRELGILQSPKGNKRPKSITIETKVYERKPEIVAWILDNAKGICEGCNMPSPFNRHKDSSPYLEVHHVRQLSHDGEDTIYNAVALCPNCHKEAHFGVKRNEFTEKLFKIASLHK